MAASDCWRDVFENWPESIPREGILVPSFGEPIPFINFLISAGIVLVERSQPDNSGARKVMVAYEAISAVKITNPLELARFQVMGFQAPL